MSTMASPLRVLPLALVALAAACGTARQDGGAPVAGSGTSASPPPAATSASADAGTAPAAGNAGAGGPAGGRAGASQPYDPAPGMGATFVSEKAWLESIRQKLSTRLKVEPTELRFSPLKQWAAFLRGPPPEPPAPPAGTASAPAKKGANKAANKTTKKTARPRKPPRRRYEIVVVDTEGRVQASFRPLALRGSDEPPRDLRFLAEDRLVYEAMPPAEPDQAGKNDGGGREAAAGQGNKRAQTSSRRSGRRPGPERGRKSAGKAGEKRLATRSASKVDAAAPPAEPPPPERLFIIQPIARRSRPIRCQGYHFAFTGKYDHLAYVVGRPERAYVAVDGAQVYPRRGRTAVASEPAWSRDGRSLAFLETPGGSMPRLVLLAEFDNPTGDVTWPLPAGARLDGARVFWAGAERLVVGKTALRPIFAAPFQKVTPREFSP